jgi:hypothetical protein
MASKNKNPLASLAHLFPLYLILLSPYFELLSDLASEKS